MKLFNWSSKPEVQKQSFVIENNYVIGKVDKPTEIELQVLKEDNHITPIIQKVIDFRIAHSFNELADRETKDGDIKFNQ